jgi:hypothetical protein
MKYEDIKVGMHLLWHPSLPGGYWNPKSYRATVTKIGKSRIQIETTDTETYEDCLKWVSAGNLEMSIKRRFAMEAKETDD